MATDTAAAKPSAQPPTEPVTPQPPQHPLARLWHSIRPILVLVLVLTAFRSSIADWNDVPTGSMKPTVLEGDRIFVNKLAYDLKVPFTTWHLATWSQPKRGDIVVFYSPRDDSAWQDGTRLVKRCVAIPGDTIMVRDNRIFINGQLLNYGPVDPKYPPNISATEQARGGAQFETETLGDHKHPVMYMQLRPNTQLRDFPRADSPLKLKDDEFFMMGDNRDNSADSRDFGVVKRKLIVGRASAVAISFDLNQDWWLLHPRWSRFLNSLP